MSDREIHLLALAIHYAEYSDEESLTLGVITEHVISELPFEVNDIDRTKAIALLEKSRANKRREGAAGGAAGLPEDDL